MTAAPLPALSPPVRERPQDAPEVERLMLRAFGPGRYAKAAERLREGRPPLHELSFVVWGDGEIVGSVRQYPVRIGGRDAIMLGPFAVDEAFRNHGLGATLITHACKTAAEAGHALVILVGDSAYFHPLGFSGERTGRVRMPGPVDQRRVLVRALIAGADEGLEGPVTPA